MFNPTPRALILTAALAVLVAAPAAAQSSLTLFSDGRVLVRRDLPARLPAGVSTHRLALGRLDAGSLFPTVAGLRIGRISYDEAVDEPNTMRRAVGREVVFETGSWSNGVRDTVVAFVLGVNPERFRLRDGRVTFIRPGTPRYPAELILVDPTVDLVVESAQARTGLPLAWMSDGASWHAEYQVVLAGPQARITGTAAMTSEGFVADSAEVQLLAGDVGRAPTASPAFRRDVMRLESMAVAQEGAAGQESIGEVHLYTLPGRHRLTPGLTTTAALFDPATTPWVRRYVLRGGLPWMGGIGQMMEEQPQPVEVSYQLRRQGQAGFAGVPLPGGTWRLYQADQAGRLQLVGETTGRHTAAGQDVELTAGSAFDLTARRIQTEYTMRREGSRTVVTVGFRVSVANARDSAAVVEVMEERQGAWRLLESSLPAERLSSSRTRFRLPVPARGEAVMTYRVEVAW